MSACSNTSDDGLVCTRTTSNHPSCTGFDDDLDDYRDWPNPNYVEPHVHTTPGSARARKEAALAATAPDRRVGGFAEGEQASEAAAERWSEDQKAQVLNAVQDVCRERRFRPGGSAGHDEFTADDVWDRLAGAVPITKGLTAILMKAVRAGWCDNTGKTAISRRGGEHDHGQRLTVWYSLIGTS